MVNTSFRDLESESVQLGAKIFDDEDRAIIADNLQSDLLVLTGSKHYTAGDTAYAIESLVGKELARWGILDGSDDYTRAFPLFQSAIIENARRKADRARGRVIERIDFAEVSETSLLPPRPGSAITLGGLLDEFAAYQLKSKAETTPAAYAMSIRALREGIGDAKLLTRITKHDVERVHALLERLPINSKQRFPGLTLERAVAKADRENIQPRLSPRTVRNYLVHFVAIFNYAIHEGYDALFRIVSMLPRNYVEARTIVQLLAENGSVTKKGQPENFQHCLDTLKQNGILKYEARARKYVLAPVYEHAIEAFKTSYQPIVAHGRIRRRDS